MHRDTQGRFILGPRLAELAVAVSEDRLLAIAQPILAQLRDLTGESASLFRRQGDVRVCVAAAERTSGLRDTIPVGAALPMTAGSAAQILLAWEEPDRLHRGCATPSSRRRRCRPSGGGVGAERGRARAGRRIGVRPIRGAGGRVIAAVSVSGPLERLTRSPGRLHAPRGRRRREDLRGDAPHRLLTPGT